MKLNRDKFKNDYNEDYQINEFTGQLRYFGYETDNAERYIYFQDGMLTFCSFNHEEDSINYQQTEGLYYAMRCHFNIINSCLSYRLLNNSDTIEANDEFSNDGYIWQKIPEHDIGEQYDKNEYKPIRRKI
jgi:hypothetical protein